jgi:hypothetical protein
LSTKDNITSDGVLVEYLGKEADCGLLGNNASLLTYILAAFIIFFIFLFIIAIIYFYVHCSIKNLKK